MIQPIRFLPSALPCGLLLATVSVFLFPALAVGAAPAVPSGDLLLRIEDAGSGASAAEGNRLEIFSIRGRKMFDLAPVARDGEGVTYRWHPETAAGGPAPSGIYLALLRGGESGRAWKVRYPAGRGGVAVEGGGFPVVRASAGRVPGWIDTRSPGPRLHGGHFLDETDSRLPALEDDTARIVPVDVDRDGDLDLFVAEFGPNVVQNRLWINDGRGFFTDETAARLPAIDDFTNDADAADIDADGDLDIVVANGIDDDSYILENDGTGRFVRRPDLLPDHFNASWGVRFCDVSGDSAPDLVFANALGRNRLYLNDGSGAFTDVSAANLPDAGDDAYEVCCVDVNGDSAHDIVFLNWDAPNFGLQNRLMINDGSGSFHDSTSSLMPVLLEGSFDGEAVDVDGDPWPDLVVADKLLFPPDSGGPIPGTGLNELQINDSAGRPGRFLDESEARLPRLFEWTNGVDVADIDGRDGPDLLFANAAIGSGAVNRLYLNNGSGFFSDATAAWLPAAEHPSADVVAADLDRDGDLDLVIANFTDGMDTVNTEAQNRILINQTLSGIGGGPDGPGGGPALPAAPTLSPNHPNPFNPSTTVEVVIPAEGLWPVTLGVYTLRGRLVRVLEDGVLSSGSHRYAWDGRGEDGRAMPSGAYLLRLGANGTARLRKMLLVR